VYGPEEPKTAEKQSVAAKIAKELILVIAPLYNSVQEVLCAYMILRAVTFFVAHDYTLFCNTFDNKETGMAEIQYIFYLSKILDFLDTVIIIQRRKWRQLSFLHTYHHTSVFLVRACCLLVC
jgi:elongation of very long chain fatty acids protein 4